MSRQSTIPGMPENATCEVHAWTHDDFRAKLVLLMRDRNGSGGVNVCRMCIDRVRALNPRRSIR